MSPAGKKLGLLLSAPPEAPNFRRAVALAGAALDAGARVWLYCIDDAVQGLDEPRLQALKARGLILYGCAYAAQRRRLPIDDRAVFAGLTLVSDLAAGTDRFLAFN